MSCAQFVGGPCGGYGPYTFHSGFKFTKQGGKCKVIQLGEFFFVRISSGHDPCIGELELLWHDRNTDQRLSSVRLYFLPEQTPDGRSPSHGQDEVLMASDKVVLRLDDLICWITDQVEWNHGLRAVCSDDVKPPAVTESLDVFVSSAISTTTMTNGSILPEDQKETQRCDLPALPKSEQEESDSLKTTKVDTGQEKVEEKLSSDVYIVPKEESRVSPKLDTPTDDGQLSDDKDKDIPENYEMNKNELRVIILSFPTYCRYRTITKRLEGVADSWLKHALVIALGGFTNCGKNTRILFCRDSFEHEELAHHELNCEYLAPTLKIKRRKKKGKNARCTSPGSESNTSEEGKEVIVQNNVDSPNGFKQPPCKTEQEFLQRLFNFMKKRKTPIHRVPHLGFKQIDLFVFFSFAQKLGGYDKITTKRLWKHVYDELGGDPGSTSAATCTRRHYEKLLLPFERFMDGKEYKPKQSRKQKIPIKKIEEEEEEEEEEENNDSPNQDEKTDVTVNGKSEADDAYAFTDSNQENSKDSIINEEQHSGEDIPFLNDTFSDEDSKSIWSIQKPLDVKEECEKDENIENKHIKPLIIQKEQNESFSEKERKWNEIRRKNALARKWVRQLRPSRGNCKSSTTEGETNTQKPNTTPPPNTFKPEGKIVLENAAKQALKTNFPLVNHQHIKQESFELAKTNIDSNIAKKLQDRIKSAALNDQANFNPSLNDKNNYLPKSDSDSVKLEIQNIKTEPPFVKTEPFVAHEKTWCNNPKGSAFEISAEKYPYGNAYNINMIHNFVNQETKPVMNRETNTPRIASHSNKSSDCGTHFKGEIDMPNEEGKNNLSQRRPSVIQHTEYVTSPSPSQSPKQLCSESYSEAVSRESVTSFSSSSNPASFKNQLSQNMAGKVSEWLAKGVPEAIACKTPTTVTSEKLGELHDKVIIPSVCKTLGPGSGKVPSYIDKAKNPMYCFPIIKKTLKDKPITNYKQVIPEAVKKTSPYLQHDITKNNLVYSQTFHPITSLANSLIPGFIRHDAKLGASSSHDKNKQYIEPFHNQSKRQRVTTTPLPSGIPPPRPSLLPYARQQTYRKSPHSDIPKITPPSHTEYENSVLDLSVKKKPPEKMPNPARSIPLSNNLAGPSNSEPVCLDLSVKKKPTVNTNQDSNAIENITPPITPSPKPVHHYPYPSSRSSKPPTLIALQDLKKEELLRQKGPNNIGSVSTGNSKPNGTQFGSTAQPSIPLSSLAMSSNSIMYSGNAQNKLSPNFIASLPDPAFTKEMAKSLYMPPDSMHFPPYVIPPFYAASWTSANSATSANLSNNSAASPSTFKETVSQGVFPKHYLYNYKNQFHPLLCKENGYYPPSCK